MAEGQGDKGMTEVSVEEPETLPIVTFEVLGVRALPYAAAPTLVFSLEAVGPSGREIMTIALGAQIMLEPAKRRYNDAERERLVDLFGPPERWGSTTQPMIWGRVDMLVPSFEGSSTFELRMPVTYDLEVAAARYLRGVQEGEAPIAMHFSGTVMFREPDGRMMTEQIPWTTSLDYKLPIVVWDELIAKSYPGGGWIVLHEDTLEALIRARAERALPSLDATVRALVDEASDG